MSTRALFLLAGALAWAQELRINIGPAAGSVVQRNSDGRADIKLAGTAPKASLNRFVEARIVGEGGQPLTGYDWRALERVKASLGWAGELKEVPQGGPYSIEIRVAGSTRVDSVKDFFIGDLWVLAGQSNMEGVGDLADVEPPDPRIRSFDQSDRWVLASEPLHQLVNATDRVHWRKVKDVPTKMEGQELEQYVANRKKGAGLGLPFAKQMLQSTGVPIGLVPCAHGGTSMDQWNPALRDKQGDSLYGATYRRFLSVGGKVRGVLWYQGESESSPKAAPLFAEKFQKLIEAFRADFAQPDLPFYYVQIGRHVAFTNQNEWNAVQEEQRRAEPRIPKVGMVPSVDLSIDDIIHISTPDLKRLARRLSALAMHDLHPEIEKFKPYRRGPRPVNAKLEGQTVRILFAEVNGKLVTTGRLAGFSIHGPDGAMLPALYKAQIDPRDGNAVLLHFGGKLPAGATVRYGAGRDPYVNLNDELDMGAPAFGPITIE